MGRIITFIARIDMTTAERKQITDALVALGFFRAGLNLLHEIALLSIATRNGVCPPPKKTLTNREIYLANRVLFD